MRKIVLSVSSLCALIFGFAACNEKKPATPMPNVVTYGSSSVTVDSIAPDSSLVVVADTTISVGVVADPPAAGHDAKHKPQGKAKSKPKHDKPKHDNGGKSKPADKQKSTH